MVRGSGAISMTTIGVAYSAAMGVILGNEGSLKDGGDQRLHTTPYFQFAAQVRTVIYFFKKI